MASKNKKKPETSKRLCIICLSIMLILTIFVVINDCICIRLSIQKNGEPYFPVLSFALLSADNGFYLSYLGYHGYLKNSRNKYQVDEKGRPYKEQVEKWLAEQIKKKKE